MSRLTALVAVTLVLASPVAGCEIRRETPAPEWPSPSAAELLRDALAESLATTLRVQGESVGGPGAQFLHDAAGTVTKAQVAALGPVYVPYPDASPTPDPSPSATPLARSAKAETISARDLAFATAATTDDAALSALAYSTGLGQATVVIGAGIADARAGGATLRAENLFATVEGEPDAPLPATGSGATLAVNSDTLAELALAHDELRYLYEVVAARTTGALRTWALERSGVHALRAEALLALTTAADPRQAIYAIESGALADRPALDATVRNAEQALGERYATLAVANPAERPWLGSATLDAFTASLMWPSATAQDLVALPGLIVP